MKPIALDLGVNMAWAHTDLNGNVIAGHRTFEGTRAHRAGDTLTLLDQIFLAAKEHFHIDAVIYETPFARGRFATRSLWGIAGLIEAAATRAGLPVLDASVATIKKFATGKGNGPKVSMIDAARRMGYRGSNEHEADAVCLLRYAEANLERA